MAVHTNRDKIKKPDSGEIEPIVVDRVINQIIILQQKEVNKMGNFHESSLKNKTSQWRQFSEIVEDHIGNYVIPQYGDFPDKTVAKFTIEKIQGKLEAYVDRIGKSSRGPEDAKRDCLKIAHFANYIYALLTHGDPQK